jgi:hypothetical protein
MSARRVGLFSLLTLLLVACAPAFSRAEGAEQGQAEVKGGSPTAAGAPAAKPEEEFVTKRDLDELKRELMAEIRALKTPAEAKEGAEPGQAQPTGKGALAPIPEEPAGPVTRKEFNALRRLVARQGVEIGQNQSDLDVLKKVTGNNETILGEIAASVPDGAGQSRYVPRMKANMENKDFRKEMKEVVRMSMDEQGTLVIRNKTDTAKSVRIRATGKETTVNVPAGTEARVQVPVGTVSTELLGYEGPKNWMLGPPNNMQKIDILPAPSPPVIIGPPVYETPITVWY